MTTEKILPIIKEVIMEEVDEVDLCLVCCCKVKYKKDHHNNNSQLLSRNLIVFYLLRRVLQVNDNEFKKNFVNCGNPVEWIKLCDKCSELTRQAEELHQKLKKIESELSYIEKLIWDKTASSINSEADRKLVEATIDLTKVTSQVWRRIRNHVANKHNLTKSRGMAPEPLINPFIEGDKLANYLITLKASTALLPVAHSPENEEDDDNNDNANLQEEINVLELKGVTSSLLSPLKIKTEVEAEYNLDEPQLPTLNEVGNYENLLINGLLGDLEGGKVKFAGQDNTKQVLCQEEDGNLEEIMGKKPTSYTASGTRRRKEKQLRKVKVKGPPSSQKTSSRYIKKGRQYTHIRTEDGKFKCRHCDKTFARMQGLNGHEREKHSKTPGAFVCEICGKAFNCRDYLRKHRLHKHKPSISKKIIEKFVKTEDGKYQCGHCDKSYASSYSLKCHENEKHSETPGAFICDICGKAFNTQEYLKNHKYCSHKVKLDGTPIPRKDPKSLERDHICDQCGKGFKRRSQLKKHVRYVHEKRFSIKCALCGAGWASSNALKKHMLAMHPEDPSTKKLIEEEGLGLWKCPVVGCDFRFLKESSIKGHLKSKHGKDEEYVEGLELARGLVLEDPAMKETCEKCGKRFVNKLRLKNHEKVHENEGKEKEFFCEICGGGFVTKERLESHVNRVHLKKERRKEEELKCELCGKGYDSKFKLKGHMELHEKEGKRDIFCDKCGHGFTLEKYLRIHKKRTSCGVEGEKGKGL